MPNTRASVRARCRLGGPAPCFDDLCHGSSTTICGLEEGIDFCPHGYLPDTCDEGCNYEDDYYEEELYEP
jgi:hypothetical protein